MCSDMCPECQHEYQWDNDQDVFVGADRLDLVAGEHRITLWKCNNGIVPCEAVFAISVSDKFGAKVYVPSTQEV